MADHIEGTLLTQPGKTSFRAFGFLALHQWAGGTEKEAAPEASAALFLSLDGNLVPNTPVQHN